MSTLTMAQWRTKVLQLLQNNGVSLSDAQQAINQYLQGMQVTNQSALNDLSSILGRDNYLPPIASGTVPSLIGASGTVWAPSTSQTQATTGQAGLPGDGGGTAADAAYAQDTGAILNPVDANGQPLNAGQTTAPAPTTTTMPTDSTTPTTPPNGLSADGQTLNETANGYTSSLNFTTAEDIINSALQTVGLDPTEIAAAGINQGQTLTSYFWSQIVNQGITDAGTIGQMIGALLPATGQFQKAFPGYQEAIKNGYVRTVSEYVAAEEGITAVMLQGGVPKDMINPTTVGGLISQGVSVNQVAQRVQNGLDAALNAPVEVQNYFAQEFGAGQGPTALATVFLNPNIDAVTLQKMLGGAEIRGAAAASNLTISQGLSQRLADQGQTYASAQAQFKNLTAQAGLFQQTVGEHSSQTPVPGTQNANQPLNESQQGVEAAFGLNANAVQQVHQTALARQNEFRGGGGASTSQAEGYSGLAQSKPW